MVDKIDRPNRPEPWTIRATVGSQDRGSQGHGPSDYEDEYSSPGTPKEQWQKFHTANEPRRILNIDRGDIKHLWFRKTVMQRQSALVECDMEMVSGKFHRGAQFLLPRLDDYFQFKGYAIGQEVPIMSVLHEPMAEVSVQAARPHTPPAVVAGAATPAAVHPAPWWSLWDPRTQQLRLVAIIVYSIAALLLMGIVLWAV